jgi:hypothetical protein
VGICELGGAVVEAVVLELMVGELADMASNFLLTDDGGGSVIGGVEAVEEGENDDVDEDDGAFQTV